MTHTYQHKRILISFASAGFLFNQKLLSSSAKRLGVVDEVITVKHHELLKTDFGLKNNTLLRQARGAGYWAWKPFIILEALKKSKPGDWVLYSDVGRWPRVLTHSLDPLIDWCTSADQPFLPGVRLSDLGSALKWTKSSCAERFGFDEDKLKSFQQVAATWSIWSHCEESIEFLEEWLSVCLEPGMIDDSLSPAGEKEGYVEHRHDQAILSCLVESKGLKSLFDEGLKWNWTHRECKDLNRVLNFEDASPVGGVAYRGIYQTLCKCLSIEEWVKVKVRAMKNCG